MDEIVKLKGTGDGVKIYLSSECGISEIIKALHDKLDEYRKFFGDGKCNIYFIGDNISDTDKLRLEAVAKAMLPQASINYGEKRLLKKIEKFLEKEPPAKDEPPEPKPYIPTMEEVIANNFKHNRARLFEGVVKPGKRVESDSHMILVGDVMEGAEICAVGNIVVFGRLMGNAIAGAGGSRDAYILALDFDAKNVAIADVFRENPEYEHGGTKKAILMNNEIFIEEFLVNI